MTRQRTSLTRHLVCAAACALALMGCAIETEPEFEGPEQQTAGTAHDHLTDHNWMLEIEGVTQGAFAQVRGLDAGSKTVVLSDGTQLSPAFVSWVDASLKGTAAPQVIELWALDDNGKPVGFRLLGAEVQQVNGKGNSAMTEEIEMVIERLERG
jgi:hypothetical protein